MGDPAALTNGDLQMQGWLVDRGWSVDLVDDDASSTVLPGVDLVVILPSTLGTAVGSKYKAVDPPVVMFASTAWDSMGLANTDGTFADSTSLAMIAPTHPVSDGLSGVV